MAAPGVTPAAPLSTAQLAAKLARQQALLSGSPVVRAAAPSIQLQRTPSAVPAIELQQASTSPAHMNIQLAPSAIVHKATQLAPGAVSYGMGSRPNTLAAAMPKTPPLAAHSALPVGQLTNKSAAASVQHPPKQGAVTTGAHMAAPGSSAAQRPAAGANGVGPPQLSPQTVPPYVQLEPAGTAVDGEGGVSRHWKVLRIAGLDLAARKRFAKVGFQD